MRLPFRRRPQAAPVEQANPTRIAVLEHDLLGIKPEPGSAAALAIALRSLGTCLTHQPTTSEPPPPRDHTPEERQ